MCNKCVCVPGAVLVDQYCNPLADVSLESISAQLDEIIDKVQKMLKIKNPSHPSLRVGPGGSGATHTHIHLVQNTHTLTRKQTAAVVFEGWKGSVSSSGLKFVNHFKSAGILCPALLGCSIAG